MNKIIIKLNLMSFLITHFILLAIGTILKIMHIQERLAVIILGVAIFLGLIIIIKIIYKLKFIYSMFKKIRNNEQN